MTVVVGADYGSEILVLSDTRVSFDDPDTPPARDGLIKVVTIRFFDRRAVLGFSGDIRVIQAIVGSLRRKAKYGRDFRCLRTIVKDCIEATINIDRIRAWIQESCRKGRKGPLLQFMLCDLDPSEQTHIYLYEVQKSRSVECKKAETTNRLIGGGRLVRGTVAAIGFGSKFAEEIWEATLHPIGRPSNYADYDAYVKARAMLGWGILSSCFQSKDLKEVGGPFVVTVVRPDGIIGPHPMWPPIAGVSDMEIETVEEHGRQILSRPSTGERHVLYSVLECARADFSQPPGAAAGIDNRYYVT
jgi:hypothetical protein